MYFHNKCYVRLAMWGLGLRLLQCTAYSSHDFGEHGNTRAGDGSQLPGVLIRTRKWQQIQCPYSRAPLICGGVLDSDNVVTFSWFLRLYISYCTHGCELITSLCTKQSTLSSYWSSQGFGCCNYRLCFLQCNWRLQISHQKVININEAISCQMGSGHETTPTWMSR